MIIADLFKPPKHWPVWARNLSDADFLHLREGQGMRRVPSLKQLEQDANTCIHCARILRQVNWVMQTPVFSQIDYDAVIKAAFDYLRQLDKPVKCTLDDPPTIMQMRDYTLVFFVDVWCGQITITRDQWLHYFGNPYGPQYADFIK